MGEFLRRSGKLPLFFESLILFPLNIDNGMSWSLLKCFMSCTFLTKQVIMKTRNAALQLGHYITPASSNRSKNLLLHGSFKKIFDFRKSAQK